MQNPIYSVKEQAKTWILGLDPLKAGSFLGLDPLKAGSFLGLDPLEGWRSTGLEMGRL